VFTRAFASRTRASEPRKGEEVGQAISELSRELSTNEIALFSIVFSAEFGQKNLHLTENKSRKNINTRSYYRKGSAALRPKPWVYYTSKVRYLN
jgi:hypothetical protein